MSNEARKAFEAQVAKPPMGCEWSEAEGKYVAKNRQGRGALGRYNRDFRIFCEGCIHQQSQQTEDDFSGPSYRTPGNSTEPLKHQQAQGELPPVPYDEHERAVAKELEERDYWHDKATELANRVGEHFGFEVGEHSNLNCPVQTALDADWPAPAAVPEVDVQGLLYVADAIDNPAHRKLVLAAYDALAAPAPADSEAEICPNCDTALPEGCGGIFKSEGESCRYHGNDAEACETYSGEVPCDPAELSVCPKCYGPCQGGHHCNAADQPGPSSTAVGDQYAPEPTVHDVMARGRP